MLKPILLAAGLAVVPMAALAQDEAQFDIGQDRYMAGYTVSFDGPATVQDVFMAGQRVTVGAPITGAAHLAGRRLAVEAAVGSDLFAAGYSVVVGGPVAGDASLAGFEVTLSQPVGGNLRAGASEVVIDGAVGGYALITGADVTLNGAIGGDAVLAGDSLTFGDQARVGGMLTVYVPDPDGFTVPESVAPAARVKVLELTEADQATFPRGMSMPVRVSFWTVVQGFVMGVLFTGLLAALVIALAPLQVERWQAVSRAHPWRAILSGFVVASALAGCWIVLAMTLVGVLLIPVAMIVLMIAVFAGYALGSYVLGSALWKAVGKAMPETLLGMFGVAVLGATVAGLAWVVPVLGWLFVMGVTLLGIGTLGAFVLPGNLLLSRDHVPAV